MTQPRTMTPESLTDLTVLDSSGTKVGKVSGVFLDVDNSKPEWAAVKTGHFGNHETLVPLVEATATGDELTVPYTKDAIKDAPHHDPDAELSDSDEAQLFDHYGIPYHGATVTADTAAMDETGPATTGTGVRDTDGPSTDDAMTLSEQRMHVGTEKVSAGTARLRKHVVTEQVTQTVPVSHEEVRIEREPITDANRGAALAGPDLQEEEAEVTLHAERPVVATETVPVERVRLATETVTEQQQVTGEVGKEVIETEGTEPGRTGR